MRRVKGLPSITHETDRRHILKRLMLVNEVSVRLNLGGNHAILEGRRTYYSASLVINRRNLDHTIVNFAVP